MSQWQRLWRQSKLERRHELPRALLSIDWEEGETGADYIFETVVLHMENSPCFMYHHGNHDIGQPWSGLHNREQTQQKHIILNNLIRSGYPSSITWIEPINRLIDYIPSSFRCFPWTYHNSTILLHEAGCHWAVWVGGIEGFLSVIVFFFFLVVVVVLYKKEKKYFISECLYNNFIIHFQ